MAERARLAKIPQPETALKCPRCESTNTKFCYFNNYSLTQPRHFCKTCRRYWTRGGALRNVPVGGGCRRNKRSKGSSSNGNSNSNRSRSKSPAAIAEHGAGQGHAGPSTSSSGAALASNSDIISRMTSQLPILPPLHHLGSFNSSDIGLNYGGIQASLAAAAGDHMEFHGSSNGFIEQWRLNQVQQFPFLTGLEPSPATGLYSFDHGDNHNHQGVEQSSFVAQLRSSSKPVLEMISSGVTTHLAAVKMEENDRERGLNLSRNFLGNISGNNNNDNQYWAGGSSSTAWTDLTGFTSSNSTTHLL